MSTFYKHKQNNIGRYAAQSFVLWWSLFVYDNGRLYRVRADRKQFPDISLVSDPMLLGANARPSIGYAHHRLWMMSLRRRHFGAVRNELCGCPVVPTTGHGTQVTVGTVPLECFTRRTGTGTRVPPLGGGGFLRVFAVDDYDCWFAVSP